MLSWYDSTVVEIIVHLSKPIEHAAPGLKPDVDCGPCVIRMCLHRFLSKCTILVGNVLLMGETIAM